MTVIIIIIIIIIITKTIIKIIIIIMMFEYCRLSSLAIDDRYMREICKSKAGNGKRITGCSWAY